MLLMLCSMLILPHSLCLRTRRLCHGMRIVMNLILVAEGTRSSVRCRLRPREGLWGWELMSGMGPGAMGMVMLIEVRGAMVVNVNVGRRDGTTMIVVVRPCTM